MVAIIPSCSVCHNEDVKLYKCPDCGNEVCDRCMLAIMDGLPITPESFKCRECWLIRKRIKKRLVCECGWKGEPMASDTLIATLGGIIGCPECAKAERNPTLECQYGNVKVVYDRHKHRPKHVKTLATDFIEECTICHKRRLISVGTGRRTKTRTSRWVTQSEAIKHNLSWLWRH